MKRKDWIKVIANSAAAFFNVFLISFGLGMPPKEAVILGGAAAAKDLISLVQFPPQVIAVIQQILAAQQKKS